MIKKNAQRNSATLPVVHALNSALLRVESEKPCNLGGSAQRINGLFRVGIHNTHSKQRV